MKIEHATARDRSELLSFLLGVFRAARPDHPPFEDIYPDLFLEDDEVLGRHAVIRSTCPQSPCFKRHCPRAGFPCAEGMDPAETARLLAAKLPPSAPQP